MPWSSRQKYVKVPFRGQMAYIFPLLGIITFNQSEASFLVSNSHAFEKVEKKQESNDYSTLTICLKSSNICNLNCGYCFANKNSKKARPAFNEFKSLLDSIIDKHQHKSRFYIDLSGDREPLLNLPFVIEAANYAQDKSEAIRKEVLVQFVCNGTLLSKRIGDMLNNLGVLYGVSLDGTEDVQNANRPDRFGNGTYKKILSNINSLSTRSFLGCALTIAKAKFNLLQTILDLSNTFPTISIKPARMKDTFSERDIDFWNNQYSVLSDYLIDSCANGDFKILFSLINGNDYFGKFILWAFLRINPKNRCDAGKGRFFIQGEKAYPCVPLSEFQSLESNADENYIDANGADFFEKNLKCDECCRCLFQKFCGGECAVEKRYHSGVNKMLCRLKKHLILLSAHMESEIKARNIYSHKEIYDFCQMVISRKLPNPVFERLVAENPNKSFQECKDLYYSSRH